MNKKRLESLIFSAFGVVAILAILVTLNFVAATMKLRVDLTADKLYTLSEGTKAILNKLDTPIKIRFYCTQGDNEMPVFLKTHAQRVEDLLHEYKQNGKGNIVIEKLDPKPDSDAEDSANLDGVEGQMTSNGEKLYLGLSISCLDQKAALPFLSPDREKLLEYDLSRAVSRVGNPQKTVVGVMSALQVFGMPANPMMARMGQQPQEPWTFINELKRDFTLKQVEMTSEKIEDDVQVLVVLHPKDISEKTQYAIDQFILRGGKMLAFIDPNTIIDSRNNQMAQFGGMPSPSSIDRLLKAWGIEMDKNKVIADKNYLSRMMRGNRPEQVPTVLSLTKEAINTEDAALSQVDSLLLPFPGTLTGTPAEGLQQTWLLRTSENSELVDAFTAQLSSDQIMKNFKPSGKQHNLAIRLTGKFKTAFPEGKPGDNKPVEGEKQDEKKEAKQPDNSLKESQKDTAVILVADADMLYDQFCVQVQDFFGQRIVIPRNGNLNLAQNFVEQLAGDMNLIGARSRATMNRPFTLVRKMQAEAEERYRAKIKELEDGLAETQRKLNEMQQNKDKSQRFILSPEQQKELEKFRKQEADAKKELKLVRKTLRQDVESLENKLKWTNILAMPIAVIVMGIVVAVTKKKRTGAK
jgi:ABC-type uncharacterized transport system involved in gliding motility auxiliary subunit